QLPPEMELGLSLGEAPACKPLSPAWKSGRGGGAGLRLGFCMGLGVEREDEEQATGGRAEASLAAAAERRDEERRSSADPPVQLELLPFTPVPRQPSSSAAKIRMESLLLSLFLVGIIQKGSCEWSNRGLDVNQLPSGGEMEGTPASSSPNSAVSSFQVDFAAAFGNGGAARNECGEAERASSRASDEEENGPTRKKLRLSKEQSAYLEESFKEHNTLNPKQKLALAKQLNLRPRQVEVWFQNRRARTKLKQTEVDCEYLKSCCEKLTEENRRLHKELQELRALKTAQPFYMQLPATTLTMCPSCERVATASTAAAHPTDSASAPTRAAAPANGTSSSGLLSLVPARSRLFPFPPAPAPQHPPPAAHPSAAS
ncbi:hypothetical protein Taro_041892, partial [Colocasia esculenta]|nr:hypothetical protein [Colocasia esculenta]